MMQKSKTTSVKDKSRSSRKSPELPAVLAGPILRRLQPDRVVFWMAVRAPAEVRLTLAGQGKRKRVLSLKPGEDGLRVLSAGRHLHFLLIDVALEKPLPTDVWIGYDIELCLEDDKKGGWLGWRDWAPDMAYEDKDGPGFVVAEHVRTLFHGSCRKPHHASGDGLVQADRLLSRAITTPEAADNSDPAWPSMLVMSGDQVYGDDIAGPMLRAIEKLVSRLGLPREDLSFLNMDELDGSEDLYTHPNGYYRRHLLLPDVEQNRAFIDMLFGGAAKPVFTSDNAHNHLVSLAEYLAVYLLCWSPVPWQLIDMDPPEFPRGEDQEVYAREKATLQDFVEGLAAVRRVFAHLPVAMIFDDHDLTDDWNLHRGWEEAVYGHPFSRRIMGNGLIAYLICQGWGNQPESFSPELLDALGPVLAEPGGRDHDPLIDSLLDFEEWDFVWQTDPPLIVLDTRTRRWRSESSAEKPSGLIDWEALTDLQRKLRGLDRVLLVSASPIFGVKLIEVIQRAFTWIGKPLLVDAENWMAHPGTANGILNVFRHRKTPKNFVVLSGDVHYSFVYDVELRGRSGGPNIWQICSSGLRNEFPGMLLSILDRLNRWLYSPRSPLNWFTSRRRMRIIPRKPTNIDAGRRLVSDAGIGVVELNEEGVPWRIRHYSAAGQEYRFDRQEDESHWQ